MKVGVFIPSQTALSILNYTTSVLQHLPKENFVAFSDLKKFDIVWFPHCAGAELPPLQLLDGLKKKCLAVVVTLHGAAPFSLKPEDCYSDLSFAVKGEIRKWENFFKWQLYKRFVFSFITVSEYAKEELSKKLKIPEEKIKVIYHGVDFKVFNSNGSKLGAGDYFLHVSQYQPKKNVNRVIEAYRRIPNPKPRLLLVVPGFKEKIEDKEITVITEPLNSSRLAVLYKNAMAFVFPSLHETFGMPIVEAMACGCPVITSNTTACKEIADNAAFLVNPYSVEQISSAMKELMEKINLRKRLAELGLERAKNFSWERSAMKHLKVFKKVYKAVREGKSHF